MTTPVFGRLETVNLRSAWEYEARDFTPWLAANLERLGDVLGCRLEHVQTEAPVTSFSADILARDLRDDSLVLIENQLEEGDHTHLGQIMTYLAGLSVHKVVWVAPSFRDAHLSAIRWLNQNTVDPFAFFAVAVRVVRIGDSALAPLFEIVERPNGWERRVQESAREARDLGVRGQLYKEFWTHFVERWPAEAAFGPPTAVARWRDVGFADLVISQFIAKGGVGLFVRGQRGAPAEFVVEALRPYFDQLEPKLGVKAGREANFEKILSLETAERANWDRMSDWLHEQTEIYVAALKGVLGDRA